jgi:hypothetical protein
MMTAPASLAEALAGRYRLEHQIGRGGMAIVYLAHDLRHDRPVALKVLRPELAAALGSERFLREIRLTARLDHPHILPVLDSGEDRGVLWYTMPYVRGETLRDLLQREPQLPLDLALDLTHQIAGALDHAHRDGVVHRDLKPENILLSESQARVADFGVARALDAAGGERITETGLVLGTPAYMSPEQAVGESTIDGRSDQYSLGCVLYEMLAGEPPFSGPTPQVVIARRMTGEIPAVRHLRPAVPAAVEQVVTRALATIPDDRFPSVGEFDRALRSAAFQRGPGRWGWIATAAAAMAVVAVAVTLARNHGQSRPLLEPVASTLAIVPFGPVVPDSELARLGRELVITLGATLDGVGGIRVADAMAVLATDDPRATYSLRQAAALGRRLNSSGVVHGNLVRAGQGVRLELGLFSSTDLRPIARASVTADPISLSVLTDSAAWSLLRQVWRSGTPPSPSLEAVTTRSIPALRAFLDGERAMAANDFMRAADNFAQAIQADSTFWLAYWRYEFAQNWHGHQVDSAVHAAYWEHRARLPERDRMLIEAWTAKTENASLAALRAVVERFPTYWPAWLLYQDQLVHEQPYLGTTYADARAALERLTALNPDFLPGWIHLAMVAVGQRDSVASGRALGQMARLGYDSIAPRTSVDLFLYFTYLDRLVRSGGAPDSVLAERAARFVAGPAGPVPPEALAGGFSVFGFHRAQLDVARRVLRRSPDARTAAAQHRGMAVAWAARGAWDSSLAEAGHYADVSPDSEAALFGYRLAAVGTWLGVVEPREAAEWRRRAYRPIAGPAGESEAELRWLDGIVAAGRRDRAALRQARAALRSIRLPSAALLDRSLAGFELRMAGQRKAAADSLAGLELELADRTGEEEAGSAHPFFAGVDRLAAARWLSEEGEDVRAARLLRWCEAEPPERWFEIRQASRIVTGIANFERARIEAAAGRSGPARTYYGRFLAEYDLPPPAHQWMTRAAEAALRPIEQR